MISPCTDDFPKLNECSFFSCAHCAVAKAIVREELVCMVYTTHELVILHNGLWLLDCLTASWY